MPDQIHHPDIGHTGSPRATVLVLQGGGALGSYQAGVFQALAEADVCPDWVAGVSIGAINASLIAGNPAGRRIERLHEFWTRITSNTSPWPAPPLRGVVSFEQQVGAASAMFFGQPGFFRPRSPLDWLGSRGPVSYYDTSDLLATLKELVDFDLINDGGIRLSLGAVEIESGNMQYFDSNEMRRAGKRISAEHVMASGALPPGFSGVTIEGKTYWDGGLVSNTPLQFVLAEKPRRSSLIFQVDLFPARGPLPVTLDEVGEREKDIRFSSRTRTGTNDAGARQNRRRQIRNFLSQLTPELQQDPVARELMEFACAAEIDVAQLIYRPEVPQGAQKDFQFDRGTMERRWEEGRRDADRMLALAPWRVPPEPDEGFRTFDIVGPGHTMKVPKTT